MSPEQIDEQQMEKSLHIKKKCAELFAFLSLFSALDFIFL